VLWLLLSLAAPLSACGNAPDPHALVESGLRELRSGDPGAAAADLSRALPDLAPEDPDFVRAQVGLAEALAPFEPAAAQEGFLAFAGEHPDLAPSRLYRAVAEAMFKAGARVEAIDVLGVGLQRFPQATELEQVQTELKVQARASATPEEVARLRSLGYLGGD